MAKEKKEKPPPDPWLADPLPKILSELGITTWDAVIVGDGSGQGWERGCGWSSVLIDHFTNLRKEFCGALSAGTVNVAELMASVHAIMWYTRGPGKDRLKRVIAVGGRVSIHVITDSEITANQGNGVYSRKSNEEVWALLDNIARRGYCFTWHWVNRDRIGLNRLTDHLSRQARIAVEAIKPPEGTTVYDYNP